MCPTTVCIGQRRNGPQLSATATMHSNQRSGQHLLQRFCLCTAIEAIRQPSCTLPSVWAHRQLHSRIVHGSGRLPNSANQGILGILFLNQPFRNCTPAGWKAFSTPSHLAPRSCCSCANQLWRIYSTLVHGLHKRAASLPLLRLPSRARRMSV